MAETTVFELLGGKTSGEDYERAARRAFGTRARIVRLAYADGPDERAFEGLSGTIAAPFASFEGVLGMYVDPGQEYRLGWSEKPIVTAGGARQETINLMPSDTLEILVGDAE